MSKLLTETADYNEDGSWGRMSNGWPCIRGKNAYDMYVFANCIHSIPYGSYVLMVESCLRVHSDYIEKLKADFKAAGKLTADESVARREKFGRLRPDGLREHAPKWW